MAKIELSLSAKVQPDTGKAEVLIRLFQGSKLNQRGKSGVFITPNHFEYYKDEAKSKKEGFPVYRRSGEVVVKNRIESDDKKYHTEALKRIESLKTYILDAYQAADKTTVANDWLKLTIDKLKHPEKYKIVEEENKTKPLFALMAEDITKH